MVNKKNKKRLVEEPIRDASIKWSRDMGHKKKSYSNSATCGGAFKRVGEKREEMRTRRDLRRRYDSMRNGFSISST